MRKEQFEEGYYYHIYNRGVDKRSIFSNDRERIRFIHSIYILNNFFEIPRRRFDIFTLKPKEFLTPIKPYVEIVAGCLMSNHYHLLVTPLQKNGISLFFHKLGTSYTKYFNIKHERKGRLFESSFQARLVDSHEYLTYLTQYIHLNPASQAKLGTGASEVGELLKVVEKYSWSTLPDYIGKESKFRIALSPSFLEFRNNILGVDSTVYQKFLYEFIQELSQA